MVLPIALVTLGKMLVANGLPILADAVLGKGKEKVEEIIGMKIPDLATAKPEDLLVLKKAEFEHQEKLLEFSLEERKLDIQALGIEVDDRKNARTERAAMVTNPNTPWLVKVEHVLVGFAILVVWGLVQYFLLTKVVPAESRDMVVRMLGTLDAALMVYLYWLYGTSRSSGKKDNVIARLAGDGE